MNIIVYVWFIFFMSSKNCVFPPKDSIGFWETLIGLNPLPCRATVPSIPSLTLTLDSYRKIIDIVQEAASNRLLHKKYFIYSYFIFHIYFTSYFQEYFISSYITHSFLSQWSAGRYVKEASISCLSFFLDYSLCKIMQVWSWFW